MPYSKCEFVCTGCGKKFFASRSKSNKTNWCSRKCSDLRTKKVTNCLVCKSVLGKNAKKYCSHECRSKDQYNNRIALWRAGKLSGYTGEQICDWLKRFLIEKYGNKCCECSWSEINPVTGKVPIQVDHIDGDYKNNTEENLRLLCPNCHSLTPNFGALNIGHGGRTMGRIKKGH